MARYLVLATAYIDGRIVEEGEEVDFSGKVRKEDAHLQLIENPKNERLAEKEAQETDDEIRAKAISAKLTEDGTAEGKLIDAETPMDVVTVRLNDYLSSNPFK